MSKIVPNVRPFLRECFHLMLELKKSKVGWLAERKRTDSNSVLR
jgi:hypothetical protein